MNGRVHLTSVGCRTNQQEVAALAFSLSGRGYALANRPDEADLIILNTCCVTRESERKTRQKLSRLARNAPRARICVTGCMAQNTPHLFRDLPRVFWVVGNREKQRIPDLVTGGTDLSSSLRNMDDLVPLPPLPVDLRIAGRTRLPVKIQEGCDHACSYCIVPRLRGPGRSAAPAAVIETAKRAEAAGIREIVLTGTHIGRFESPGWDLARLITAVLAETDRLRIRLSSLDPRSVSVHLLSLFASEARLCPHLHLSVQSLSQPVLTAMNRPFKKTMEAVALVADLRKKRPELALGCDLIVGHPGETPTRFEETCSAVGEYGFTYGHVFRFSARPETPAAAMDSPTGEDEKKRRARRLADLLRGHNDVFLTDQIGRTFTMVVEKTGPVCRGTTENYLSLQCSPGCGQNGDTLQIVMTGRHRGKQNAGYGRPAENASW